MFSRINIIEIKKIKKKVSNFGKLIDWATSTTCTGQTPSNDDCKSITTLEGVNSAATFTCVSVEGKIETVKCVVDGKESTQSGKAKTLRKWASSSSCISDDAPAVCKFINALEMVNPAATFTCVACKYIKFEK